MVSAFSREREVYAAPLCSEVVAFCLFNPFLPCIKAPIRRPSYLVLEFGPLGLLLSFLVVFDPAFARRLVFVYLCSVISG